MTIVRTSAGAYYLVEEASPPLPQAWMGRPAKVSPGGGWAPRLNSQPRLLRKAGCVVVQPRGAVASTAHKEG